MIVIEQYANYTKWKILNAPKFVAKKIVNITQSTQNVTIKFYSNGTTLTKKYVNNMMVNFDFLVMKVKVAYNSSKIHLFNSLSDACSNIGSWFNEYINQKLDGALNRPPNLNLNQIEIYKIRFIKWISNQARHLIFDLTKFDLEIGLQIVVSTIASSTIATVIGTGAGTVMIPTLGQKIFSMVAPLIGVNAGYQELVRGYLGGKFVKWVSSTGVYWLTMSRLNFQLVNTHVTKRYVDGWDGQMRYFCPKKGIKQFLAKYQLFFCKRQKALPDSLPDFVDILNAESNVPLDNAAKLQRHQKFWDYFSSESDQESLSILQKIFKINHSEILDAIDEL